MDNKERWSRNCGSGGIGHSGYNTEYKSGVLIANWVENLAKDTGGLGDTILTHTGPLSPPPPINSQRLHYTEAGKTGAELLEGCERHDLYQLGIKGELLTRHGRFDTPPVQCLGTTYQLTHCRADGTDRRVQSYLWHGQKRNDMHVPTGTTGGQLTVRLTGSGQQGETMALTGRKTAEWAASGAGQQDPYATTQKTTSLPPALVTAEAGAGGRTGSLRPLADSGMPQHPGQRPKGEARDELDKEYRRIGLRANYRS